MSEVTPKNNGKVPSAPLPEPQARAVDFQVISKALKKIQRNKKQRKDLLAKLKMAALKPTDMPTSVEAEHLVKTLNELVRKIEHRGAQDLCLDILSQICSKNAALRNSCLLSDVVRGEKLKVGRLADIWTGTLGKDDICIKIFRPTTQAEIKEEFYCHIGRWKNIEHENVLPFLGVSETFHPFGFISPRMSSNIREHINRPYTDRLRLLTDAACGLEYLHSLEIVHGGISPENILVTRDDIACIGDFQVATIITDPSLTTQHSTTTCRGGVVRYIAPEQANPNSRGQGITKKTDIYSFAITTYQVLTGNDPYPETIGRGDGPLVQCIANGVKPPRPEDTEKRLPDVVWKKLESCWAPEPGGRPPIEELRQVFHNPDAVVEGQITRGGLKSGGLIGWIRRLRHCLWPTLPGSRVEQKGPQQ